MSRREIMGYAANLRAPLWKSQKQYLRALVDYQKDMRDRPYHPAGFNNFAWLVATVDLPERQSYRAEALKAATQAITLQREAGAPALTRKDLANYLDTLACVYAYAGDFTSASTTESEAISISAEPDFRQRLERFKGATPADCTGER